MGIDFNFKNIIEPLQNYIVYKNYYWLCLNGNHEQALFFGDGPQCNKDERVCKWMLDQKQFKELGNLEIVFIETAFIKKRD